MVLQNCILFKDRLNLRDHQINCDVVLSAFRNNDVRVAFRRFNKLIVHRSDDGHILLNDRID